MSSTQCIRILLTLQGPIQGAPPPWSLLWNSPRERVTNPSVFPEEVRKWVWRNEFIGMNEDQIQGMETLLKFTLILPIHSTPCCRENSKHMKILFCLWVLLLYEAAINSSLITQRKLQLEAHSPGAEGWVCSLPL